MATPWDDCPYTESNANTFVGAHAYRVFLTSCVGINLWDIPRGLRHSRDVPLFDYPHSVGKPYTNSPPSSIVTVLIGKRLSFCCAGINEICRIFQWPWYWCSSSAGHRFTRSASCSSLSRSTTIGPPASAALTTSSTWPRVRHPSHKMKISSSSRPFLLCASYEPSPLLSAPAAPPCPDTP